MRAPSPDTAAASPSLQPTPPDPWQGVRRLRLEVAWTAACALAEALGIGTAAFAFTAIRTLVPSPQPLVWASVFAAIGAVEGFALGVLQQRVLRRRLIHLRAAEWVSVSTAAAMLGWLFAALAREQAVANPSPEPSIDVMMGLAMGLGALAGAAFGAAQALVLRRHVRHAARWIGANAVGWAAAMPLLFFGASICQPHWSSWAIVTAGVASGVCAGAALGLLTSVCVRGLVPWVDEQSWSLQGKVCAVTGANRGIGLEVAKSLARMGARVVLLCRDAAAGQQALDRIRDAVPNADVHAVELDLTSQAAVRRAANELQARFQRLDVLVNNAGALYAQRTITVDGVEATLAVDAVGPFLLTALLRARLERVHGRVINVAGIYQRRGDIVLDDLDFEHRAYDWIEANNQAQLARVVISAELARRSSELFVASVHPGAVWTALPAWLAGTWSARLRVLLRPMFVTPELGAMPIVRLAADPGLAESSGRFFDVHTITSDAPDALLGDFVWNKFEELVRIASGASLTTSGKPHTPSQPTWRSSR